LKKHTRKNTKMSSQRKIAIIGAGHVGSHCAMSLAAGAICDEIVLVDTIGPKAKAQALDISDALSHADPASEVAVRAGSYADCGDADIVVVAAGEPRLPGQTRLDLLERTVILLDALLEDLRPLDLRGIVVTITNPADIAADIVRRGLGLPRSRAFGTGTLLDTARLQRILSELTGRGRSEIDALVMGEHGDSSMIPFSQVSVGGRPFASFPGLDRAEILGRTRLAGMDIINGKGSTEFGIAQALAALCRCILRDERRVLPLSASLEGEYGQSGIHCGVPCLVGRGGIESIMELPLEGEELTRLGESCDVIRRHADIALKVAPSKQGGITIGTSRSIQ
jgi:L-lactate dehydrogenase